ncbi:MAG: 30S ribosomal protein S21 [Candidatus Shapirobacteria bacterium]
MATIVRKGPGDSDDRLIAKFRKKVLADDILADLKDKEHYLKPSEKRQLRMKMAKRGQRRQN